MCSFPYIQRIPSSSSRDRTTEKPARNTSMLCSLRQSESGLPNREIACIHVGILIRESFTDVHLNAVRELFLRVSEWR